MRLTSTAVASSGANKATILATLSIGTQVATETIYTQYHGGTWWLTGGGDSGRDLGF